MMRSAAEMCSEGDEMLMSIEQPKPYGRKESLQKERQISVDPVSLKGGTVRQASFSLVSGNPPAKLKFMSSCSLPRSTSSSPRSGSSSLLKKIWTNEREGSPRIHSSVDEADFDISNPSPRIKEPSGFKCGKLCMFLPRGRGSGRGKKKPVKSISSSSVSPLPRPHPISRTVSLERFDCGSVNDTNLFFDLPLELIRCSVSDMQSPVTTAFLFDKDHNPKDPKGVLKKTPSCNSKSQQTPHVRFSTSSPITFPSSPASITPRLRKATTDFTAFLQMQTT